jgi:hypothetical protein
MSNKTPSPTKEEVTKWCKALRSGKYKQDQGALQSYDGFCCLGVATKVFVPFHLQNRHKQEYSSNTFLAGCWADEQPHAPEWLKQINDDFEIKTGVSLSTLNDGNDNLNNSGYSFNEIADLIEAVYVHNVL